ncbi:MAG: hypothetical protein ACXWV4_00730, partial [Flavitalea sp.]
MDEKEIIKSSLKILFSTITYPFLGATLNELLDARSKIKQERLNQFTELLENFFSNHKGINLENFQTVEFGDLFESVIKRVVQTKQTEKLHFYKNILANQLKDDPHVIDYSEIFLDLLMSLQIVEINILMNYHECETRIENEINGIKKLESLLHEKLGDINKFSDTNKNINTETKSSSLSEIDKLLKKRTPREVKLISLLKSKNDNIYSISEFNFLFYKQRLFSKGILIDDRKAIL